MREPAEFAAERIHGALNFPLSTFDPGALPEAGDRLIVFQCGTGKRSGMAVERCRQAGHKLDAHLAGGITAWKSGGPADGDARRRHRPDQRPALTACSRGGDRA